MRLVIFDPNALTEQADRDWWDDWSSRAYDATTRVLTAWKAWRDDPQRPAAFDYKFEESIWKEVKGWFLEHVFYFRCAYCESPLDLDRYYGDAEHFRPKGNVTVGADKGPKKHAKVMLDGEEINHPGYFWLAYHWRNLLPACSFCNSRGKSDLFPASKTHGLPRILTPAEKAALMETVREFPANSGMHFPGPQTLDVIEEPLLLNPFSSIPAHAPSKHIRYGITGKVVAVGRSPLGHESIEVYKLNRGLLPERRREAQDALRRLYYGTLQNTNAAAIPVAVTEMLQPFREGKKDFATAALQALKDFEDAQRAASQALLQDI